MREDSAYCHLPGKCESIYYGLSAKIFPTYLCLVCRLYTASLEIHTEHSRKDLGIFCEELKFESFGLRILTTWTVSTFKPAVNEEKLWNTQSRIFFRDCRQTFLLPYLSSSVSAFLFFLQFHLLTGKKVHIFPWDFWEFPLK